MSKPIRWAIIGSGNIAARFASDFAHVQGAELVGVLSRREPAAREFAARFALPKVYTDLDALLAADVQAVYLATPHTEHPVHALACLDAGVAVLSEKPAAPNLPTSERSSWVRMRLRAPLARKRRRRRSKGSRGTMSPAARSRFVLTSGARPWHLAAWRT